MKFKYNDEVENKDPFFGTRVGRVVDYKKRLVNIGNVISSYGTHYDIEYYVKFKSQSSWIDEKDLTLIKPQKKQNAKEKEKYKPWRQEVRI